MNEFPDITDDLLIKLAGKKAFAPGKASFEQWVVSDLKTRGKKITGMVPVTHGDTGGKVKAKTEKERKTG